VRAQARRACVEARDGCFCPPLLDPARGPARARRAANAAQPDAPRRARPEPARRAQGRAHSGLSYSGAVGGGAPAAYDAAPSNGSNGMHLGAYAHAHAHAGSSYASADSGANGGAPANGGSAYSSGSGGGRFESGGSEAGGGFGGALGGRPSLEDVSPPGGGGGEPRRDDGALAALSDYLPANDRTAQALQARPGRACASMRRAARAAPVGITGAAASPPAAATWAPCRLSGGGGSGGARILRGRRQFSV